MKSRRIRKFFKLLRDSNLVTQLSKHKNRKFSKFSRAFLFVAFEAMADDREVLREVWEGRIPACFSLASSEVDTLTAPDPFYLMLPRLSYLPIVTDKVKKHFAKSVSPELASNPLWFEFDGSPLKWHRPIGVLFDQALLKDPELRPPWNVTVHFGQYPEQEILKCESRDVVRTQFMSSIKEADQLKHGGKIISMMQKKDHNQLWQGLHNDKFDQFWAVNRLLMEGNSTTSSEGEDGFKNLPIRLFDKDKALVQKLYKAYGQDRRRTTLKDLLAQIYPDKDPERVTAMVHGVQPPKDTPLQWMAEHLSYPDNFLYICLK